MLKKLFHVLLVEDSDSDIILIKRAIEEGKILLNLSIVKDGEEALDFLKKEGEYQSSDRPDFIILDLNIPKISGMEVLKEIREDPKLKNIPVGVLTISSSEQDVLESYDYHANFFITKPMNIEEFRKRIQTIEEFWFTIVKFPSKE